MPPVNTRTGGAMFGTTLLVLAALLAYMGVSMTASLDPEPVQEHELAMILHRTGLAAEPLAAAGVSAAATSSIVADMRVHLTPTTIQSLRDADQSLADRRAQREAQERLVRSGQGGEDGAATLANLLASESTAAALVDSLLDEAFAAAAEDLTQSQRTTLLHLKANRERWDLPTQYLASTRDEERWLALREALSHERIAAASGQEPDTACRQIVLAADGEPAVAAAAVSLDTNLDAVRSAWTAAIEE